MLFGAKLISSNNPASIAASTGKLNKIESIRYRWGGDRRGRGGEGERFILYRHVWFYLSVCFFREGMLSLDQAPVSSEKFPLGMVLAIIGAVVKTLSLQIHVLVTH